MRLIYIASVGGSAVGEPIEMEASLFGGGAFVPASAGADGRIVPIGPLPLGSHDLTTDFPALGTCLQALGHGGWCRQAHHERCKELAAYAAVMLEDEMATTEAGALRAGETMEELLKEKCSPRLTRLRALHGLRGNQGSQASGSG